MTTSVIPKFWYVWLTVAFGLTALTAVGTAVFPEAMVAATMESLMGSSSELATGSELGRFTLWLSGVSSAVSLAWMATAMFIVWGPYRRGEGWAWWALAVPIVTWFVVDSARSIATGLPSNAILNVGWLAMYGIPLLATFHRFRRSTAHASTGSRADAVA